MLTWKTWTRYLPVLFFILSACSHQQIISKQVEQTVFVAEGMEDTLISQYAPAFLIDNNLYQYNKIGRPSAKYNDGGRITVYVDTKRPTIYYMVRKLVTDKASYTNFIYRVHFSETPFNLFPFHLTAGKNVGLMAIITVDDRERPVLITTVHTCGCYLAIVPTSNLPHDAFPKRWKEKPLKVYGEKLPWILKYENKKNPKLLVRLRSGVHRVMDLQITKLRQLHDAGSVIESSHLMHLDKLEKLPLNGSTTSFYHHKGPLKGHVKGAIKPWESILLSLISLDLFVGTDKAYANTEKTGNPFYTSLKPWNRRASDMWDFNKFLMFWGWNL